MRYTRYLNKIIAVPNYYANKTLLKSLRTKNYSAQLIKLIQENSDKSDFVLEIGSGLGVCSCFFSNLCSKVVSIEANPLLDDALKQTKELNELNNVEFISGIVANDTEEVTFYAHPNVLFGSAHSGIKSKKPFTLHPLKISSLEDYNKFNVLCLDCQGGEIDFIENNEGFLKQINKLYVAKNGRKVSHIKKFNDKLKLAISKNSFNLALNTKNFLYFVK